MEGAQLVGVLCLHLLNKHGRHRVVLAQVAVPRRIKVAELDGLRGRDVGALGDVSRLERRDAPRLLGRADLGELVEAARGLLVVARLLAREPVVVERVQERDDARVRVLVERSRC